jgi:NADP-dependent 3-hydroxy acid dehydrogenase YdfG
MSNILGNTVALVTGASSGIGEATAVALAGEGAAVALVARRGDRLEALAARIAGAGGRAVAVQADITVEAEANDAVERAVREFGRLDTVVNSAGLMLLGPLSDADTNEWKRMFDINVAALMHVSHAALPHLLRAAETGERRVADLVNISSVAGRVSRAGAGAYNATKFAIGAFSEALRQEVTSRHVRVSLIEPGYVATELQSHNRPEILEAMRTRYHMEETLQADEIADAIRYIVTRRRNVAINEMLIRPTEQEG